MPSLNINIGVDEAVFRSGRGNRELAESYASGNSKYSLEMTSGGRYLESRNLFDRYSSKVTVRL